MEQSDRRPSAAAPSLISGGAARSSIHEPTRILASLEGRVGTASSLPRRRGKVVGIAGVTLIVAAALIAGLWAVEYSRTQSSPSGDPATVVARSEAPTASQSEKRGVPAAEAESARAAATIVNLQPPELQVAPAPAPPRTPVRPSPASNPPSGAMLASAAPRKAEVANHAPTHAATAARKNKDVPPAAGPRDADVDLLAALVAHLNDQPPEAVAARKSASVEASGARNNPIDVAPNVVAQTTQEQIAQCNALGFFEARSCRLRVCVGRIGKDSACTTEDALPAAPK